MAHELLAPWAEVVPGVGRMTIDEMVALPDDGWRYELVDGRLVRMLGSGYQASRISIRLAAAVLGFAEQRSLGDVTGADGTFDLTLPGDTEETALVPDLAFIRADRAPTHDSVEYTKAPRLAPDLVAEVVSPSQFRPEMAAKARRYLAAGVRLVWMVWPKYSQVDVWRLGADQPVATLNVDEALDGEDVLPGISYPLAKVFT